MKKLVLIFVISFSLLTVSLVVYLLSGLRGQEESSSDAIIAIPSEAAFILKINNYHLLTGNLQSNNHFWDNLKNFNAIAKVDSILSFLDTLTNRSSVFNQLLSVNPVYISTQVMDNADIQVLAAVKIPKSVGKKDLTSLAEVYKKRHLKIVNQTYHSTTISTFVDSTRSQEIFSFTIFRGIAICGNTKNLIENSIDQIEKKVSLVNNPAFISISHTAGTKVEANLFINNKHVSSTFRHFLIAPYNSEIKTVDDIAQWSELDITIKNDAFFLNGFSLAADSSNSFLKTLSRQRPLENKIASILPSETAVFICLGISDLELYLEDYRSYLDHTNKILAYTGTLNETRKTYSVDIHDFYRSFFNKEIALFTATFDGIDTKDCWFIAAKTNSLSQAKQSFINIIDAYVKKNKLKRSDFVSKFKVDSDKSVEIYRLPFKGINQMLLGSLFSIASDDYFTFIDDYVVFGASKDALAKVILSNIHNNQLQLDVSYRQFSNVLASESNYFFYLNPLKAEKIFSDLLEPKYAKALQNKHTALGKIQGVAVQLNGGGSMIFNNISLQYSPYTAEEPQTFWETRLDTTFTMKPQIVTNHFTGKQEIIVQDLKNKLYLVNDVGRILWTKNLPESICGNVIQVDLLKNNKLQYLFSTRNYIYAVDRKGEFVDGFPIKLKSSASNPVAVFDYDNSRDYRLFIACDDRKIYAFSGEGKPISGWFFSKSEKIVTNQLQHFRVKGKDYIVFADANRLYILGRKGEERISIPRFFSKSSNSRFIFDSNTKNHAERIVTTDSVGLIKFIYFNGKVEDFAIKAFSSHHVFEYLDVDYDGEKEFLFLDKGHLYAYNQNKTLLFSYAFETAVLPNILTFSLSKSDQKLGFVSNLKNEIYLLNGDGSLYNGFPLNGSTLFSAFNLSVPGANFNIITGSSSGVLLNYSVK